MTGRLPLTICQSALQRAGGDPPRLTQRGANRGQRIVADDLAEPLALDPELALAIDAENAGLVLDRRLRRDLKGRAVPLDRDGERCAEAHLDERADLLEGMDRPAVDRQDPVTGLEAGLGGGAVGDDLAQFGRGELLAVRSEKRGEHDDGENEVGDRPGSGDQGTPPHGFVVEGDGRFGRGHRPLGAVGQAHDIAVAEHLHIAAERQSAELPARAAPVGQAEQLRPEPDGEDVDANAAPAGDEEMAELVDEHEHGDEQQEAHQEMRNVAHETHHDAQFAPYPPWDSARQALARLTH